MVMGASMGRGMWYVVFYRNTNIILLAVHNVLFFVEDGGKKERCSGI